MNKALALIAKAFKLNNILTNNNQRSSLIPRNSQIAQPDINMCQDIKMKMVDDNVRNQVRQNAVQNDGNEYGNRNVVTAPAQGNGNGINEHSSHITYIQHPQPNNNFVKQPLFNKNYMPQPMQNTKDSLDPTTAMNTTLALLTKAFKVNTIPTNNNQRSSLILHNSQIAQSEDTLQQASTSGTQSDNARIYDSDGSTKVPKENCYDHDIYNMLTHKVQSTDLQTELDRTKE
uniref:Uncharacterized protein n=1 Tax=Tanacetum cinerariifolium TaxID=118510 RepID=A0A6L2P1D1_TANCI|nr:hypothetical protein [Tanacetum cinerariifolium]